MKTRKRKIAVLWRGSKLFEFLIRRGEDAPEQIDSSILERFRKFSPAAIVFGWDRLHDRVANTPIFAAEKWGTLWRYAELEAESFDQNCEMTEPVRIDLVA